MCASRLPSRSTTWVAEAYAYPVRQPEGQGKDRILVFEDEDGDGRYDRKTVFADDLNLVSAIEIGFGGVWVGAAPHLLFIPMQDGDAPKPSGPPQVMLDGWGYEDTHETLNSFIWGPDGWLYGAHGVFTNSSVGRPGTPDADRQRINGGIWRFHPTTHRFEIFSEGLSNPWGLDFNDHGHAVAEACVIPHLWHIVQGARYQRQAGQHFNPHIYDDIRTIADHLHYTGHSPWDGNDQSSAQGGGHAHAGLMVYLGGSWPETYRNQAFMSNIHGARINVDALEAQGSGYVGRHAKDFLEFNDPWSQVVNLQYDQDGSVFMIDWYDQEQCHLNDPEVPDRGNGRIFKVVYGDTRTTRPDVQRLSDDELVGSLLRRNDWHVRHARRVLQERAAAGRLAATTVPRLRALLGLEGTADTVPASADHHALGSTEARLRLLWALHVVDGLRDADLVALTRHEDAHVRSWTVQLAAEDGTVAPAVLTALADLARRDDSPTVALYLASAVQRLPLAQRWPLVEALHAKGDQYREDHNLPLMAWWALEPLAGSEASRAIDVALSSHVPRALEFTARRVAATGRTDALNALVTAAVQTTDEAQTVAILTGMNTALRGQRDVSLPAAWASAERALGAHASARVRTESQALGLTFGSAPALQLARETLEDIGMPAESRRRALTALVNARDANVSPLLLRALDDRRLRRDAIRSLAAVAEPRAPQALLALYPSATADEKRDILLTLSSRTDYAPALAAALDTAAIPARDVTAEIARQMRLLGDAGLTTSLERVWGVARTDSGDRTAEIDRYRALVQRTGGARSDASRGRAVFNQVCGACHALFGEGGTIGPDITGSNRTNLDYLLHNILDPNAEIPNAYRATTVTLRDGRVLSGVVGAQDGKVVTVVTTNETVRVPRADIATLTQSDVSMMPEGLLAPLNDQEVRDLVAYLRGSRQVALPR
jgi:putative membrane-bound dehydrogenase-like protein